MSTPAFRKDDHDAEMFEAQFRQRANPVSAEQAKGALLSLPQATQAGVANLVADHGAGAREHLAYQATGDWTASEREALRTLAAATPHVRAEATRACSTRMSTQPHSPTRRPQRVPRSSPQVAPPAARAALAHPRLSKSA